jgi:F-type H+-transporting ATPase subunit epsilon
VKIIGDITLDDSNKSQFEKKGKGYWYAVKSGAIEMNANKIIVLAD